MKKIGLIGGMSWESTVTYYQIINETIKNKLGDLHSAKIIIESIDFDPVAKAQEKDDWDTCAKIMREAVQDLEKAGADFILIGANTMHKVIPQIENDISIPILHIADATITRLKQDNIQTIALLGTKYTMCQDFYKSRIVENNIEVMIPEEDIETVNSIIYDELCKGILSESSKNKLIQITNSLKKKGAQGVILGCTELDLLIKQDDLDIPVYDTTQIHGEEAGLMALEEI